jgi:hypothetical protein
MKNSYLRAFAFLVCAALPCGLFADTVTLNTGEKIEGTILKDKTNETQVVMEVKVSESITDERTIARSEIQSIDEVTEDDVAFNEIKGIRLNPQNSVAPETYTMATGRLKAFAEKYPLSPHLAAVNETLAAFEAEQKRVAGGEIKVFGKWLSKEEAAKQQYQIQAQVLLATMRDAAARSDSIGALNAFDALETKYPGSSAYPESVGIARQVLGTLAVQVANSERMLAMHKQQFTQVLASTQEPKKTELIRRMAGQEASDEAAFNAAKGKWKIFIPRSEKSIAAIKQMIPNEISRLASIPVQGMKESIAAVESAKQAIEAKNMSAAQESLEKAKSLWAQNEAVNGLTKELGDAKAEAKTVADAADTASAKAAAAKQKQEEAQQKVATEEAARPFYMTLTGALTILGGIIAVIFIGSIISKVAQSRAAKKEDTE